ncbi:hypothetical protein PINS_up020611, partial [Pythium insidiosum]
FNASLKRFFLRRRCHMLLLFQKLRQFIRITNIQPPMEIDAVVTPNVDLVHAPNLMMDGEMPCEGWRVQVHRCRCHGKYFIKFQTCAHVIVARAALTIGLPGSKNTRVFESRIVSKR